MMVFFRTRLVKILILQKFSETWESDFKFAQHMLNVFFTENLSIPHKILIGLKDQFDLPKLQYFFMKIRAAPCGWYFYWYFLVKAEEIVILRIKEEEYLVRHFQSNEVDNPCVYCVLPWANLFLRKRICCFLCFADIFCYL